MIDLNKFANFIDSDEGKESIRIYAEKLKREQDHKDRWVEKFKSRCETDLDSSLEKLMEKYYSDEYVNRERKKGFEPREELIWIAWEYAIKYCKECKDESFANDFTGGMYHIGSYVIQIMYGQGAKLIIDKNG
jgi:hypothetical protein